MGESTTRTKVLLASKKNRTSILILTVLCSTIEL